MSMEQLRNVDLENDAIPVYYGLLGITTSLLFFAILNKIAQMVGPPSSVTSRQSCWKWYNLVVSWAHAVIVGVWTLTCFYRYPELTGDLVKFCNTYIYSMVAVSTGYFLYDFIDILFARCSLESWEVVIHHVLVVAMFSVNLFQCKCVAYTAVALLVEINTIFLHARKLLQMMKVPFDSWIYRANSAANLMTFISCRFVCLAWISYGIVFYREIIGMRYWVAITASTFIMYIINIVLFWRILTSDYLRTRKYRPPVKDETNGNAFDKICPSEVSSSSCHSLRRRDAGSSKQCSCGEVNDWTGMRMSVESHMPDLNGIKQLCYQGTENGHLTKMHLDFDGVLL